MSTTLSRVAITGGLFLFIFVSGFWLSRSGKPYHAALFNVHKLIALGAVVFLILTVTQIHKTVPFNTLRIIALAVTALCVLVMFVSGGLLSVDKTFPEFVKVLHRVFPYLTALSASAVLYLLL